MLLLVISYVIYFLWYQDALSALKCYYLLYWYWCMKSDYYYFCQEFFLLVVHLEKELLIHIHYQRHTTFLSPYILTQLIIVIMCHCISQKTNYAICWLWISATDLATHFTVFKEQQKLLVDFQKHKADQRRLLLCLCMTASDLSDQTKDWSVVRETAVSINKNKQMNPWVWY